MSLENLLVDVFALYQKEEQGDVDLFIRVIQRKLTSKFMTLDLDLSNAEKILDETKELLGFNELEKELSHYDLNEYNQKGKKELAKAHVKICTIWNYFVLSSSSPNDSKELNKDNWFDFLKNNMKFIIDFI